MPAERASAHARPPLDLMASKSSKKDKSKRKNTSLRLDESMLKQLKIRAVQEDTSVQKIVEKLVRDYLRGKSRR